MPTARPAASCKRSSSATGRQDKAKAEQARLDKIAATHRKHAEEAVDVVMRAGADRLIE